MYNCKLSNLKRNIVLTGFSLFFRYLVSSAFSSLFGAARNQSVFSPFPSYQQQ
jgi:hypothetical protein